MDSLSSLQSPARSRPISPWSPAIAAAAALAALASSALMGGQAPARDRSDCPMIADRLFFGRSIPDGGSVTDEDWARFLAEEITPRFPGGLTVWRAEGQWADASGRAVREPALIVEVVHPAGPGPDARVAAIARAYRRRFRQEAVLRVATPTQIALYE